MVLNADFPMKDLGLGLPNRLLIAAAAAAALAVGPDLATVSKEDHAIVVPLVSSHMMQMAATVAHLLLLVLLVTHLVVVQVVVLVVLAMLTKEVNATEDPHADSLTTVQAALALLEEDPVRHLGVLLLEEDPARLLGVHQVLLLLLVEVLLVFVTHSNATSVIADLRADSPMKLVGQVLQDQVAVNVDRVVVELVSPSRKDLVVMAPNADFLMTQMHK